MKPRVKIAIKVATSNKVRAYIMHNNAYKIKRVIKLTAFSHTSRVIS